MYCMMRSKLCHTGRTASQMSPGLMSMTSGMQLTWWRKLWWESTTPLGVPVVPEVKMMVAVSSG